MRLLLDTHALIFWLLASPELPRAAVEAIADPVNEVYVSAASVWEMTTKARIGKLPSLAMMMDGLTDTIAMEGFMPLPISLHHAAMAGSLVHSHRDPFDRMLIAQSLIETMVLVSNEVLFDQFGVQRLWSEKLP